MAVVGVGFSEFLILVILGTSPADLLSLIHAEDYFKHRQIVINTEKMIELAGANPTDGKTQIQQLLALRYLGANADAVRKSPQHAAALKLLNDIAAGKKAQDELGFARDYASRALALLEGRTPPVIPMPEGSLRADALAWFPTAATLVGAADFRGSDGADELAKLRTLLAAKTPAEQKEQIYAVVEKLGNVRIDRVAFAYVDEPQAEHQGRIYIRFTGKLNRQALIEILEKRAGFSVAKKADAIVLEQAQDSPALIFAGMNDIVIAGYQRRNAKDSAKLVEEVLALRSEKAESVLAGPLKQQLEKVPQNSNGLLVGAVPEDLRRELVRTGSVTALPKNILATIKRDNGLLLKFEGAMTNADEAKTVSKEIAGLRKLGLEALEKVPPQANAPVAALGKLRKTLESIEVNSDGGSIRGSARLSGTIAELLPYLMLENSGTSSAPPKKPAQP